MRFFVGRTGIDGVDVRDALSSFAARTAAEGTELRLEDGTPILVRVRVELQTIGSLLLWLPISSTEQREAGAA